MLFRTVDGIIFQYFPIDDLDMNQFLMNKAPAAAQ